MAYDRETEQRIDAAIKRWRGFTKKKMFGGVGYLLYAHMCFGVWREFLIVRCGADRYEEMLGQSFVKKFDITGRAMTGWVMVHPEGFADPDDLGDWLGVARQFVRTLPATADGGG